MYLPCPSLFHSSILHPRFSSYIKIIENTQIETRAYKQFTNINTEQHLATITYITKHNIHRSILPSPPASPPFPTSLLAPLYFSSPHSIFRQPSPLLPTSPLLLSHWSCSFRLSHSNFRSSSATCSMQPCLVLVAPVLTTPELSQLVPATLYVACPFCCCMSLRVCAQILHVHVLVLLLAVACVCFPPRTYMCSLNLYRRSGFCFSFLLPACTCQ